MTTRRVTPGVTRKRGVGVGIDNELARQRLSSSRGVSIPTCHRKRDSQLVWRITVSRCKNTITEDKLANTFASRNKTGNAPTAHTRLALRHRVTLDAVAHWWVPARTHGTPVLVRRKAVGGPQPASHDNTETTRPRFTASRFGYQQSYKKMTKLPFFSPTNEWCFPQRHPEENQWKDNLL